MTVGFPKATEEELERIIGRLNDEFALELSNIDTHLSPSKRRAQARTQEQRRIDSIYSRVRTLHYQKDSRLSTCLAHFRTKANELLQQFEPRTRSYHGSGKISVIVTADARAALHDCLLDILSTYHEFSRPRRSKRPSDELPDLGPKRARSQTSGDRAQQSNALDAIPVRSSDRPPTRLSSTQSVNISKTTSTSGKSFVSEVFSIGNESLSNSQTTIETSSIAPGLAPTQDSFPWSTGAEASFNESFSQLVKLGASHHGPAEQTIRQGGFADDRTERGTELDTEYSSVPGLDLLDLPFDAEIAKDNLSLDDKLENVWPRLPTPGLNEAPLGVLWEVTRASIHCGVDLYKSKMVYKPGEPWHDQHKMRAQLISDPAFVGKGLPPVSDKKAWEVSLDTFHADGKSVILSAELVYRPEGSNGPLYDIRLNPLNFELGHRLGRRFGADRFLEVFLPSPTSSKDQPALVKYDKDGADKIVRWLTQKPHYFLGRFWVAFHVRGMKKTVKDYRSPEKSHTTYPERVCFFAVDGNHFRSPSPVAAVPPPDEALTPRRRTKLSLRGLLNWAVSFERNSNQPVPKLFSRLNLSLTRAWSTVVLEPHQIRHLDRDIGTHEVMNDGIGRLSRSLARKIADSVNLSDIPCAFQGRIGSAKGMWIIDTNDNGLEDWIETYPSQRKWDCDFRDPLHRTFEVKGWPAELKSAALNQQFIPVLESRSRDPEAMRRVVACYLLEGIRSELDELKAAMHSPLALRAWLNTKLRQLRDERIYLHGHTPFIAGLPDGPENILAYAIDSGFKPDTLDFLADKVFDIGKKAAEVLKAKLNVKIPCSTNAYMVADFEGILEENEVHLSFSTKFKAEDISVAFQGRTYVFEGFSDTNLEGCDILVARSPAHFPTDIQKVRVVSKPQLRRLKDVIVFSTKGKSPLADKLSGGDYDGDKAWVCWDQAIVSNFRNASTTYSCPDLFEKGYMRKCNPTLQQLFDGDQRMSWDSVCMDFTYRAFAFNMDHKMLGQCTKYKEKYCYWDEKHGIESEAAFLLSSLLSNLVDQPKQGTVFREADWDRFVLEIIKGEKFLGQPAYQKDASGSGSDGRVRRGPKHVLDWLVFDVAVPVIEEARAELSKATKGMDILSWDNDLTKMHNEFDKMATESRTMRTMMNLLKEEIRLVEDKWKTEISTRDADDGSGFQAAVQTVHQDWIAIEPPAFLKGWLAKLLGDSWSKDRYITNWELLKASTTFYLCYKRNKKFVWWMAGRQLGVLKARAHGSAQDSASVLVVPEMWAVLKPDRRMIKRIGALHEAGRDDESAVALDAVRVQDEGDVCNLRGDW